MAQKDGVQPLVIQERIPSPPLELRGPSQRLWRGGTQTELRSGNPLRNPGTQIGVEPAKGETGGSAPEEKPETSVAQVTLPESVAVGDEGPESSQAHANRVLVNVEPDLVGEEASSPPVVVASDEVHPHTPVHQGGEPTQHPCGPSGNDAPVLEPEIEEIAIEDQVTGPGLGVVEPGVKVGHPLRGGGSEVQVTGHEGDGRDDHGPNVAAGEGGGKPRHDARFLGPVPSCPSRRTPCRVIFRPGASWRTSGRILAGSPRYHASAGPSRGVAALPLTTEVPG